MNLVIPIILWISILKCILHHWIAFGFVFKLQKRNLESVNMVWSPGHWIMKEIDSKSYFKIRENDKTLEEKVERHYSLGAN